MKEKRIKGKLLKMAGKVLESTGIVKVKIIENEQGAAKGLFSNKGLQPDAVVKVSTKDRKRYMLFFEVKSAGQPRYARMAVNQLKNMVDGIEGWYGVFAAAFISDESKQICRENGIGFIDLAGNCLFKFDNVYINIGGRPNPYPNTRPLKSIFSTKSSRVLRVMLCNPKKEWSIKGLSAESGISLGQAFNVKQRLLEFEFIEETNAGKGKNVKFRVKSPESLLIKWSDNYSYKKNAIRNFYSLDDLVTIEQKLAGYFEENAIPYAFTLTSGASRVAPFLRYTRVFSYVQGDIDRIAEDLKLKRVTSGANISFLEPYDGGVLYGSQEIEGVKVVSNIQLYLDLQGYGERGKEAAEFLLEQRLRKQW